MITLRETEVDEAGHTEVVVGAYVSLSSVQDAVVDRLRGGAVADAIHEGCLLNKGNIFRKMYFDKKIQKITNKSLII